ncbi:EVE domain-containing protein [Kangiella sediminilitoris]|uniref:EVE domain-containing protein n=1 Tax=Kangiella sediminilitoris TaxID=1144748 RepID=A0A1B3B7V9_9GAMM|nr:EVE domain-containing protein [Kangiella sediminilitoris]AOE48878.1 EVE domain-containing protein [Kangiella sediminilitoris]
MAYWLMKSEPDVFGIEHLKALPNQTDHWDGVRNYQARNMMRDDMKVGDQVFFYHSNCKPPAIVGIMEVTKEGYPDHTAFDPDEKYYDPKSNPDNPRWYMVDVKHVRDLKREIPLDELKSYPELSNMRLVQKGNRLSIMPIEKNEWDFILSIEDQ